MILTTQRFQNLGDSSGTSAAVTSGYGASLSGSNVSPGEGGHSTLELEAVQAVHELNYAVNAITVSDMLPRTPQLIFVNVTTLEGQAYCLELTMRGWRVTSLRHDCMNGDINQIDLHTRYFESAFALMDRISPGYNQMFHESLSQKLAALQESSLSSPSTASSSYSTVPAEEESSECDTNTSRKDHDATQSAASKTVQSPLTTDQPVPKCQCQTLKSTATTESSAVVSINSTT